jgi:hypothetical protein
MTDVQNSLIAKGFFSLEIENPDGTIAGKVENVPNLVTRLGFQHICLRVGTNLTGTQFSHLNVGEGAAPATNATSLPSEVSGTNGAVQRQVATASTQAGSVTLRFLGTMSSANSFVTASENISNVGIFNHSSGSSCVAGAAYASSTVATNQNVNITYDLVFETA